MNEDILNLIHSIWETNETFDKYSIVLKDMDTQDCNSCLSLSHNPTHPQGISQFTQAQPGKHLGIELKFNELPINIQEHIISRLS